MQETDLQPVLSAFFPQPNEMGWERYGSGHINDTYRVWTRSSQVFLLQRLNHQVFKRPDWVMENIRIVCRHLAQHPTENGCLLAPQATLEGELLFLDEAGQYWRVFPFYEGTYSPNRAENPLQAFRAAQAIGRFLQRLSDLDPSLLRETIPGFHDSPARLEQFELLLNQDPVGRCREALAEIEFILDHADLFAEIAGAGLPIRVVHNDAKLSNVLFLEKTNEAFGLIDWDTIMPGILLSDFGDLVRSAAATAAEDERGEVGLEFDIARALCEGFTSELRQDLQASELEYLPWAPAWITLEQAMRFLADFLAGDVYYRIRYPDHNLMRARNQLSLFRALKKAVPDLRSFLNGGRH